MENKKLYSIMFFLLSYLLLNFLLTFALPDSNLLISIVFRTILLFIVLGLSIGIYKFISK